MPTNTKSLSQANDLQRLCIGPVHIRIYLQSGDKSVARVCKPGPADEEYRCGFMGTKDFQIAWDHGPGTVQLEVVVAGGAEIMEL